MRISIGVPDKKTTSRSPNLTGNSAAEIKRYLKSESFTSLVKQELDADIGPGDLTAPVFESGPTASAEFLAKESGILSGIEAVKKVFSLLDPKIKLRFSAKDGDSVKAGDVFGTVKGSLAVLLQGERTALNFIQHLSGIATLTGKYVAALGAQADRIGIYDTRKTLPLLRALEKKAVLDGGGHINRFALYDMAMLKNNHIDAVGGIAEAVDKLKSAGFFKRKPRPGLSIECRDIHEAVEATWAGADIVLLDNMTPAEIRKAATAIHRESESLKRTAPDIEISGGITLKSLPVLRYLPIQRISVGAITHSAPGLDIAMHIKPTVSAGISPAKKRANSVR